MAEIMGLDKYRGATDKEILEAGLFAAEQHPIGAILSAIATPSELGADPLAAAAGSVGLSKALGEVFEISSNRPLTELEFRDIARRNSLNADEVLRLRQLAATEVKGAKKAADTLVDLAETADDSVDKVVPSKKKGGLFNALKKIKMPKLSKTALISSGIIGTGAAINSYLNSKEAAEAERENARREAEAMLKLQDQAREAREKGLIQAPNYSPYSGSYDKMKSRADKIREISERLGGRR